LYFTLGSGKAKAKTYGGVLLQNPVGPADDPDRFKKPLRSLSKKAKQGELLAKVEVNVTGIAKDLGLGA
jgi:hypothetical protein